MADFVPPMIKFSESDAKRKLHTAKLCVVEKKVFENGSVEREFIFTKEWCVIPVTLDIQAAHLSDWLSTIKTNHNVSKLYIDEHANLAISVQKNLKTYLE